MKEIKVVGKYGEAKIFAVDDEKIAVDEYELAQIKSLGTLGFGNHYIEIDVDDAKNYYLCVHSGSRHLGKEVAELYLTEGQQGRKFGEINLAR